MQQNNGELYKLYKRHSALHFATYNFFLNVRKVINFTLTGPPKICVLENTFF